MSGHYWTSYHQDLIWEYYQAQYTGGTQSGETRSRILSLLYPVFKELARRVVWSLGWTTNDDVQDEYEQECIVRISYHLLPRLNGEKISSTLKFLFITCRRYLITERKLTCNKPIFDEISDNYLSSEYYEPDYNINKEDMHRMILRELDRKICEQRIINGTAAVLLINLKEYLIQNNMDPRGFREYILPKMNIKESTYSSLMSKSGVRRKPFNEKIIKDDKHKK